MPNGRPASSTDSTTWSSYDEVRRSDHGFALGAGIGCIDLDHCVTDGRIDERAQAIIDRCPPTYIEISPSGTGLHIWGHLAPGPGSCRDGIEVYSVGRYITVTGKPIPSSARTLADLTDVVATL